jgi:hypothetical protein
MKTQEAKQLSLPELLSRIGHHPVSTSGNKLWYRSPLRHEQTPSFCVEPGRQVAWIFSDHGANVKGNILDFVMYYQQCSVSAGLAWLKQIFGTEPSNKIEAHYSTSASSPIQLKHIKSIQHPALITYLRRRAIELDLAKRYLWQMHYHNNGRPMFALGWRTDNGGWCLRANNFKASISPVGITTIGSSNNCLAIFEGMFDFLAGLSHFHAIRPRGQVVILNSVNQALIVMAKIGVKNYQSIKLYLDNDDAGKKTTQYFLILKNSQDCSPIFYPAKDFAEFHQVASKQTNPFSLTS